MRKVQGFVLSSETLNSESTQAAGDACEDPSPRKKVRPRILTVCCALRLISTPTMNFCHVAPRTMGIAKSIEIARPRSINKMQKGSTPWKHQWSQSCIAASPGGLIRPAEVSAHLIASQLGSTWRHTIPPHIRWILRWRGCCSVSVPSESTAHGVIGIQVRPTGQKT